MFVERLIATLRAPHGPLEILDETLPLDGDRYRALVVQLARARAASGLLDEPTLAWLFRLAAEGWIDEHLQLVRDALLELGVAQGVPPAEFERLIEAAARHLVGEAPRAGAGGLSRADVQLLLAAEQCAQPGSADSAQLGLRPLARRYARALGLIEPDELTDEHAPRPWRRTPLGDAALSLPRQQLVTFLLALEASQSTGALGVFDRYCTPRRVLKAMLARRRFVVPTSAAARRVHDADGLFPWRSVRRLHLLGVIEPVLSSDDGAPGAGPDEPRDLYLYRLTPAGEQALGEVLREPPGELVQLVTVLVQERCERALRPLLRRTQARLTPIAVPVVPPPPSLLRATELPSDVLRQSVAQHVELPPGALEHWLPEGRLAAGRPVSGEPRSAELSPELAAAELLPMAKALRLVPSSGPETPPQELDMGKLIQRAWDELQVQRVGFSLQGPGAQATADRRALLQGWRELLRATADAALQTAHGAAQVAIEVTAGDELVIALVHDNGPPIEPSPPAGEPLVGELLAAGDSLEAWPVSAPTPAPASSGALLEDSEACSLPDWLASSARAGLWRAQRALTEQGALLSLLPPRLGGVSLRVALPRRPRPARTAA